MLEEAWSQALGLHIIGIGQTLSEGEVQADIVAKNSTVSLQLSGHRRQHFTDDGDHVSGSEQTQFRYGDFDALSTSVAELIDRLVACGNDGRVGVFKPGSIDPDLQAFDPVSKRRVQAWRWLKLGIRIGRVITSHDRVTESDVSDGRSDWTDVRY